MVKQVTFFSTLIKKARELAKANKEGKNIAEAQREHDTYRELCLKSDCMIVPDWRK